MRVAYPLLQPCCNCPSSTADLLSICFSSCLPPNICLLHVSNLCVNELFSVYVYDHTCQPLYIYFSFIFSKMLFDHHPLVPELVHTKSKHILFGVKTNIGQTYNNLADWKFYQNYQINQSYSFVKGAKNSASNKGHKCNAIYSGN